MVPQDDEKGTETGMAFSRGLATLIAELTRQHVLKGRFLHFGRLYPNVDVTPAFIETLVGPEALRLAMENQASKRASTSMAHNLDESSESIFFRALGFDGDESLDVSNAEQPTHCFDLNKADLPETLRHRYDTIYNNGTLEHIFDVPQVLRHVHEMLKTNGVVIHVLPVNNHMDHGFYQFSPILMLDYYAVNGYEILESRLCRRKSKQEPPPGQRWGDAFFCSYDGNPWRHDGVLDCSVYVMVFVVRKLGNSRCDQVPQQGDYVRMRDAGRLLVNPPRTPQQLLEERVDRSLEAAAEKQPKWLYVYGFNDYGRAIVDRIVDNRASTPLVVAAIIDRQPKASSYRGVQVISPIALTDHSRHWEDCVFILASDHHAQAMRETLMELVTDKITTVDF